MSFFQKIQNAIIRFMYGRNGFDQLNRFLFWVVLALDLVCMFLSGSKSPVWSVFSWVLTAAWVYLLFRTFSRNLPKRRAENQKWVDFLWRIRSGSGAARARHADKDHKYFTCKSCKTICRVPVGKGKIIITCPKCGAKIEAKT